MKWHLCFCLCPQPQSTVTSLTSCWSSFTSKRRTFRTRQPHLQSPQRARLRVQARRRMRARKYLQVSKELLLQYIRYLTETTTISLILRANSSCFNYKVSTRILTRCMWFNAWTVYARTSAWSPLGLWATIKFLWVSRGQEYRLGSLYINLMASICKRVTRQIAAALPVKRIVQTCTSLVAES